ncbi:MAG: M24 family metallopeptidase [Candidatus Thorarchaeota archaeon]
MLADNTYRKRMKQVVDFLGQQKVDLALLTPSPAFQYLTGIRRGMMERIIALLIEPDESPKIIAPEFEVSSLSENTWVEEFVPWAEDENPYGAIAELAGESSDGFSFAFDEHLPLGVYWKVEKAVGGFKKMTSLTPIIEQMRLLKGEEEIGFMKKAGEIVDVAVRKAYSEVRLGMSELEMQQIVHAEIARQESQSTFAAVQFGENSALPHASPSARKLKRGDIVLLDCGCVVGGYHTDMTRVGVAGPPSEEQRRIHSVVLEAQQTAIEQIRPGSPCGTVDGVARRIIEEAGYGEFFTHRLGHGIGIQVHEPPYLVRGNAMELQSGMTHSVEPGIYLETKFGIRIENLVCVREDAAEVLTYTPRELIVIDT